MATWHIQHPHCVPALDDDSLARDVPARCTSLHSSLPAAADVDIEGLRLGGHTHSHTPRMIAGAWSCIAAVVGEHLAGVGDHPTSG